MSHAATRLGLVLALALVAVAARADEPDEVAGARNVIVILVDDLGAFDLSCQGSAVYRTPNIDRLAADGVRFTNAYAAAAVCSPTRAALLTGRYPARLGITDYFRPEFRVAQPEDGRNPTGFERPKNRALEVPSRPLWMDPREITLAEVLDAAGFVTAHVGKWHLGRDEQRPEDQGFDHNRGGCDFGQPPSYFDPYVNERAGGIPTLPPREEGEYLTDRLADEAVAFIREHHERRFFLHFAPYAVHTPIQPRPDRLAVIEARDGNKPARPAYGAMVETVDEAVGRVLDVLDDLSLTDDTLILFTSDNGGLLPWTDNAPLRSGKGFPYEGGLRVPLLIRTRGARAGSTSRELASSIDVFSTVLELTGVEAPPGPRDGRSLAPYLSGDGAEARDALFWHFPHYRGKLEPYSVARVGDWKLIRFWESRREELFDLASDPGESVDVAASEPRRAAALSRRLDVHLLEVGAKLPRTPAPPSRRVYLDREIAPVMTHHAAEWLTRVEREREENTSLLFRALDLRPGATVADFGCGNGYHSLPMARQVGAEGRVLGVEIQPEMLHLLMARAAESGIGNIHPILAEAHDPRLPDGSCDLVLMVDVYHELDRPEAILAAVKRALKPDGVIALVEFRLEDPDVPIKRRHKMTKAQMLREFEHNGFEVARAFDELPWQHLVFFRVAEG